MKVLIFTPQFHQLGGAERSVIELAVELNKRGIHADILSMYSADTDIIKAARDNLYAMGIPNILFLELEVNPSFWSLFAAILRLRRIVAKENYTVVEASMISPSIISILSFLGDRVKTVIGIRHVYKVRREKSIQQRILKLIARLNRNVEFYSISNYARNAWLKYSQISAKKCSVIYNSIPNEFFDAAPDRQQLRLDLGIPKDAEVIVYVGRLAKYKGVDVAFNALKEDLHYNNRYLIFVGHQDLGVSGTSKMLDQMHAEINERNLHKHVRFLGIRNDIARIMASSDVLIHPSRTEAFGRSLAEALAAQLPIVASDAEAIPEILSGTLSILVNVNITEKVRAAVLESLNREYAETKVVRSQGLKKAQSFRIEERTDLMIDLFKK
jgi:glycosyltransferase involved in cell wall biosynthesis